MAARSGSAAGNASAILVARSQLSRAAPISLLVAEATHVLGEIVGFLRARLVPYARAEEQVLYPAVEEAMAAPGATATMRADHVEIVSRIDRLAGTAATVAGRWTDPAVARDLSHQLVGLSAILLLHFRKEEDVLLPVLDTTLGPDDAAALFARMGEAAHP